VATEPKIGIDPELHREFKSHCRQTGVLMRVITNRLISEYLDTNARKKRQPKKIYNGGAASRDSIEGPPFWERKG